MRCAERWPMYGTQSGYAWSTHKPATKPTTRTRAKAPPRRATLGFMSAGYRLLTTKPDARVLVHAVRPNLEMKVWTCRPPGRSLEGDCLAPRHHVTAVKARGVRTQMPVVRLVTIPVI